MLDEKYFPEVNLLQANKYLYWFAVLLYYLQPGPYLKAVPLLILATTSHDNTWFMRAAFLFAGIGDFMLEENRSVIIGTSLFGLTNLCLGIEFFLHNYFTMDAVTVSSIISTPMFCIWFFMSGVLYLLTPEYPMFICYSLLMGFSLTQARNLMYKGYTVYFMYLFLVSDLMVLIQYTDIPKGMSNRAVQILHWTDLVMYWSAMFGISHTYNLKTY
jgi:hypothetical protein